MKVGGELAVMRDSAVTSQSDLFRGELFALPILLLALLLVFRGLRAALMPIIGALVTVAGALLLLRAVTGITDVSGYAVDVVALFGIALAVDYSLLMVNRFREERAAGHDAAAAVARTVETAGRTITYLGDDRDRVPGRAVRVRRPDVQLAGHRRHRHHPDRRCSPG